MAEIDYFAMVLLGAFSGFGGAIGAEFAKYFIGQLKEHKKSLRQNLEKVVNNAIT